MSNPERSGYNSQNGGAGPAYSNGPVPNPLMHSPQVSTGQGYNAAYPGSYPHSLPVKAPLHPSSSGQYTYGGLPNVSQLEHFQGPGQTLNRPQMALATTAPLPGTSSFPRMPPPPQNSVTLTAPSTGVASGAHPSPNPGWQYGAPHVNVLPVGPQTNHVAHHTGTLSSQTPLSGNTRPPTSHPYVTSSSGPPLQSNYTSPGPAPPPMSAPLGLPYQPAKPQLCPPPVGGMSLNRPSAPPTGLPSSPMPPQPQSKSAHQEGSVPAGSVNDGSLVQNSYDAIEGGGYMASTQLPPPPSQNPKMNRHVGYSYPALPPGYQNVPQSAVPGQRPVSQQQYPPGPQQYPQPSMGPNQLTSSLGGLSLQQSQQPEGLRPVNLLQERNMLPPIPLQPPVPNLHEDIQKLNCSPELFRSTLTNIPQTQTLLNKAKLPLGLLIHPFKDLSQLPVVTSSTIVRCRSCRTYINPFVSFLDQRRWKCNLCYRVNDVPEEFMYNPVTRVYGEPHKRPEVQNATIEFMAPSEYMLRPPQPPVYLFMFDVSHNAVETGYLNTVCKTLLDNLDLLPGNSRTKIGFITFDSTIHFYSLQEGLSQPQMLIVSDIEDVFIPMPENLLVNLNESKELVQDLLKALPQMFTKTLETQSALGPALQAVYKLMAPTGGRISVFQTQLPSVGVGALKPREEPNQKTSAKDIHHLTPATDFYKKLALDCSGQQIAVDLFLLNGQYSDLASLGCISRYSAGSVFHYQSYHHQHCPVQVEKLEKELKRYLTRKIGFEAVMRIRCTKALAFAAGTAAQLSEMIKFMTYTYSLANYTNYGCHCGSNTQGVPVDETDWCCHEHACCYNKARMMGCVPEATTYRFYAYKDKIKCIKTHNKCEYEVCDCDEEAADCFRKRLDTYNLHFRNMTASPSCHGPRPFC